MLALAVINDFAHPPRDRGAAEGRRRRHALPRGLAAQRRGRADAGHDRRAASRAGARRTPRSPRCSSRPPRKTVAMAALTRTVRQAVQVLMLALGAWLVISGEATRRRDDRDHHAARPRARAGGAGRRQLAHPGRRARRVPPPARRCSTPPTPQPRAHGAARAERARCVAQNLMFRAPQGERMLLAGVSLQLDAGRVARHHRRRAAPASRRWCACSPACGSRPPACVRLDQADLVAVAARRPRPVARLRAAGRRAVPRHAWPRTSRAWARSIRRRSCRPRSAPTCTS